MKIAKFLSITFFLVFGSCKKEGRVTGRVTNLFDGTPAAGIDVGISYSNGSDLRYRSGELPLVTTDNNGEYAIDASYKSAKRYEYRIALIRPGSGIAVEDTVSETVAAYFYSSGEYSGISVYQDHRSLTKGKHESYDFEVVPAARLRVVIKDVPPFHPNAFVEVQVDDPKLASRGFFAEELGTDSTAGVYHYVVAKNNQVRVKWTISNYPDPPDGGSVTISLSAFKKGTAYIEY
jgi:hypothetical protein